MKKKSRFLTGLLSAVMALSLCAMPVMAEDGEAAVTVPKTNASTIDTSKTGSITIHKYVMENLEEANKTPNAEGNQDVPANAEAIDGVGFSIYKVMTSDELVAYYNGEGNGEEVTIRNFVTTDSAGNKTVQDKEGHTVEPVTNEQFTDKDGVTTFANLEVGLYVVMETTKPAAVTVAVDPFLVSIPMTRIATDGANKEWLYDVHVYPKNSTKTGDFELVKYGAVGDDKRNAQPVEGVQFKLEQLKNGKTYPADAAESANWEQIKNFVTDNNGRIQVKDLKPGTYRFTEIGYDGGKENKYIVNKNDQYVFVVNEDGTAVTIPEAAEHKGDYTAETNKISVYNYVPDVDKKVKANGTTDTWQEAADYSVGDTIEYQITVTVPANIARLKTFTVTDTPTNLTDKADTIKVKDPDGNEIANEANAIYTVEQKGDGFEIAFAPANLADYAGQKLTITYNATLKDSAVTTTVGNPNTVNLIYSKNVKQDDTTPDGDNDKNTIKDDAVVYTFEIKVIKKADNENGKALNGVTFDLYKQVEKGAVGAITDDEAKALGLDTNYGWVKVNKNELITADGGKIQVSGLANGTYKLVETKTVEGYNLLSKPMDVTLNIQYKTTWKETNEYKDGVLTKHEVSEKAETFGNGTADDTTVGAKSVTIINRKGFDLPVTGGFGTLLFSAIGVLLVVGGVGVLMSTKKKKGNA